MTALEIQDLLIEIGRISIKVESMRVDKRVVLLGPNGAGKSTLLRCIAGFIKPKGGIIKIDGNDVTLLPPEKRSVGYLPQRQVTLMMRPKKLLATFARTWRVDPREVIGSLGLGRILEKDSLSGGEYRLLMIGIVLLRRPTVLLLDEPTGSLDWPNKQIVWRVVNQLSLPTIVVTHDPIEAVEVADEIYVMKDYRVLGPFVNEWRDESSYRQLGFYRIYSELLSIH